MIKYMIKILLVYLYKKYQFIFINLILIWFIHDVIFYNIIQYEKNINW